MYLQCKSKMPGTIHFFFNLKCENMLRGNQILSPISSHRGEEADNTVEHLQA